ncbi:hypothetical protein [Brevibacillus borstelensis]|uniref:hypothetical protein n=1 Tax=Brevibacillus borstelensis TaxID=45462 RepID=UPI002E1DA293|nr:hypothetical protein [Brevibacillus borstelensis]
MMEEVKEQQYSLAQQIDQICYCFYRYEINNGLRQLDEFISELTPVLMQGMYQEEQLKEMNELLGLIAMAVEKGDFLLAADFLKYELLKRMNDIPRSSS